MSRVGYVDRLLGNLPECAAELPLTRGPDGLSSCPPSLVELRRWGKGYSPLDYQQELLTGLVQAQGKAPQLGLLAMPTGSGKTLTCSWIVLNSLLATGDARSGLVVWIAPQRELLQQAAEALQAAWWSGHGPASLDIRIVDRGADAEIEPRPTVLLLTPIMLRSVLHKVPGPSVAVFDEAHHAAAEVFGGVWSSLTGGVPPPRLSLGLSATPTRRDRRETQLLRRAFGNTLFVARTLGERPLDVLMDRGVLARPRFCQIEDVPAFAGHQGVEDRRSMRSFATQPERWKAIVRTVAEVEEGQTLVFALDREHGKALTRHLSLLDVSAEYVDGETSAPARTGVFERFRNKQTRVLVSVSLLIEGVDCPAAEAAVLTCPVLGRSRFQQMIGRVLRGPALGGTEESRVWGIEGSQALLDRRLRSTEFRLQGWSVRELG